MTQYAIVTDLNRCVGCLACCTACKTVNDVPIGSFWNKVLRIGPNPTPGGSGQFPDVELYFLPIGCQHCAKPECVKVCPTGASQKMNDGTVQIDKGKCIGCQFCVMACPYGVRYLNKQEKVVEKCTLCEQRTSQGELPQCVAQCGGYARFFGDIEGGINTLEGAELYNNKRAVLGEFIQPYAQSEVYSLPDVGNGPSFRYILRGRRWHG
ncbi:MAG: 4Fe-4S dicluster domain-containing protein [Coriobacteriales bacterium]|nr:4Fe-4S dicluster domain-containing protein [Coriobacteriales bacterium]MBQ6586406.1 4Fe-4S dicluster domain-containing protein [Coriobacteriales bacterium]